MVDLETFDVATRRRYDGLPEAVQKRFHEYPPNQLYLLTGSNHIVQMYAYTETEHEDGSISCDECQVLVLQKFNNNKLLLERRVFGIPFDDLEPVTTEFAEDFDREQEAAPPELVAKIAGRASGGLAEHYAICGKGSDPND